MQIEGLDEKLLPRHVGIIMDGNGRWARKQGKKRVLGHQEGSRVLKKIVKSVFSLKIPFLSLYVFSVDNWKREMEETSFLMKLIGKFYQEEFSDFKKHGIRVIHGGIYDNLPKKVIQILKNIEEETVHNTAGTLNLCLNYGGRLEIVEGIKKLFQDIKTGKVKEEEIDSKFFSNYLFHPEVPDVDLMIRTSGELRLSDFLLWKNAYSEFWFTDTLWPDFNEEELFKALKDYQNRQRRFGDAK